MAPDVVTHIFEPFFTTKPVGQGTGLGLATVYGIVKQSNGYITVDSEAGAGTTFTIYFPRMGDSATVPRPSHSGEPPLHGTETILVADDEGGLRQVIQRALTRYGYTVLLASDGVEALEVEQQYSATIDLLLSDVIMREMGGPELAQRLVSRRPQMKVLLMSGFEYKSKGAVGEIDIGTAFLSKPFTPDGLARKVREVLNRPK
jgi:two-component system cell cycle sensor histidine kinase/response regulator CckA